jgi:large subunit ribosomal protein L31
VKEGIHPTFYADALVVCGSCGASWQTGSTKKQVHVDICSNCHPFFTGTQRIVDTAGQVERFSKRLAAHETLTPQGEARVSKKQRRAAERAKRSGVPEEAEAPEVAAETAPAVEASASETTADAPAASAPRERKPRPPRERKPREDKPAAAQAEVAEATSETASLAE